MASELLNFLYSRLHQEINNSMKALRTPDAFKYYRKLFFLGKSRKIYFVCDFIDMTKMFKLPNIIFSEFSAYFSGFLDLL